MCHELCDNFELWLVFPLMNMKQIVHITRYLSQCHAGYLKNQFLAYTGYFDLE